MISYNFISYRTFYKNRHYMRERYKTMTYYEKLSLKRYLYSITIIKTQHKDLIWEYLNEPIGSEYYVSNNRLRENYMRAKI